MAKLPSKYQVNKVDIYRRNRNKEIYQIAIILYFVSDATTLNISFIIKSPEKWEAKDGKQRSLKKLDIKGITY